MSRKQAPLEGDLPRNEEAERNLIAMLLIDPDTLDQVSSIVRPRDFYDVSLATLYAVMLDMYNGNTPIDIVTLMNHLTATGKIDRVQGGMDLLTELSQSVGTTANVTEYAQIVREYGIIRRIIETGRNIAILGTTQKMTAEEYMTLAEQQILAVRTESLSMRGTGIPIDRVVDQMSAVYQGGRPQPLLSTYITDLDALIGGLYRQEVVVIAARPSIGKTLLATWLTYQVAEYMHYPVLFVSAEMSAHAITYRIAQAHQYSQSQGTSLVSPRFNSQTWPPVAQHVAKLPIRILDAAAITVPKIRAAALSYQAANQGVMPLVIIDYLQLLTTVEKYRSRYEQVSALSSAVKGLAKDLDVPIVLLAQLNRQSESRPDRRPQAADLRDSGTIEQDVDVIILLHRPGHYLPAPPPKQNMDLIVAKARNHKTGSVQVMVDLEWQVIV